MKQCIALAGVLCLLASGCAGSGGLLGGRGCCSPCHVATSRNAPRPTIMRNSCRPCCGGGKGMADLCSDDSCCEESCGCGQNCDCGAGCDGNCDCGAGCGCNGRCRGMVDGIAGGFCGRGGACGGSGCGAGGGCCPLANACPNAQGYPEQPAFTPGPQTGQVAYPYYTVRGPRDFLACKPQTIGPY